MSVERWLEFHDSHVVALQTDVDRACVELDAYVQQWEGEGESRRGTGWMQQVLLELETPIVTSSIMRTLPAWLWDGNVLSPDLPEDEHGTLTVPIVCVGPAELELTATSGEVLKISGRNLRVTIRGEPRFVEELPACMDPDS